MAFRGTFAGRMQFLSANQTISIEKTV